MARQQRSTTFDQESTRPITRVALYARVSTLNNQDPEMQLSELREYAGRRGWQIVEEFTDHGVSGCRESRPTLNRLVADACRRRFDAVLVWKIDRFGRSLKHLVNALAELAALGVAFISLRDNLDLSTPSRRLMFQIIGAMAEFERALIQERVRAGLRNARAKRKAPRATPRCRGCPHNRQSARARAFLGGDRCRDGDRKGYCSASASMLAPKSVRQDFRAHRQARLILG
jgi:DNA invertase Pin-like site-specific DNA recombinase